MNLNLIKFFAINEFIKDIEKNILNSIKSELINFQNNCSYFCFKENKKMINDTNICISQCINDNTYKYEYNNLCYKSCPIGTHSLSSNIYICEEDLVCQVYYSYDKTSCLNYIPEGYFCNDTTQKTIDKCNIKCRTCNKESNLYNLCLSCNNTNFYYQKIIDNSNINSYINCYNSKPEAHYWENNIYKPCYLKCKNCDQLGTEINNKCTECYSNSTLNGTNCYEKCSYYYYFDSSNVYHCTISNNCSGQYNKLISDKNRCIDNCNKDELYKMEYNNQCYKKCPIGTHNQQIFLIYVSKI